MQGDQVAARHHLGDARPFERWAAASRLEAANEWDALSYFGQEKGFKYVLLRQLNAGHSN
jgi:hypothetical protein